VLRLSPGDRLIVFDDTGWEHEAVIRSFSAEQGDIELLRSFQTERESPLEITLALGVTKGEKMDFVVEKATELGTQTIAPFLSTYAVPKLNERKIEKRTERWQRITVSAAKQSGRARIPKILPLCEFSELISQPWTGMLKLLFWEREAQQTLKELHQTEPEAEKIILVIGPEGGFSFQEADTAHKHGFKSVGLGRRILRAETAAITATSLVQFLWGDLG
jgi:16S rRNA (uracil1498-N3)-methyltransferase